MMTIAEVMVGVASNYEEFFDIGVYKHRAEFSSLGLTKRAVRACNWQHFADDVINFCPTITAASSATKKHDECIQTDCGATD